MELHDQAEPSPEARDAISAIVTRHTTLERVVNWGFAQDPLVDIADILVQDEFTHDVIVPFPAKQIVLVYDST